MYGNKKLLVNIDNLFYIIQTCPGIYTVYIDRQIDKICEEREEGNNEW